MVFCNDEDIESRAMIAILTVFIASTIRGRIDLEGAARLPSNEGLVGLSSVNLVIDIAERNIVVKFFFLRFTTSNDEGNFYLYLINNV